MKGGMGEKGDACLYNVSVFPFGNDVLLGCMRACVTVLNACLVEIAREATILTSPIGLHNANFCL